MICHIESIYFANSDDCMQTCHLCDVKEPLGVSEKKWRKSEKHFKNWQGI